MKPTRLLAALFAALLFAACDNPNDPGPGEPASMVIVSGDLQTATVATELAQPLVVRVLDGNGHPVRDQIVNFRVTAGNGTVFAGAALTNRDGEARERWRLGAAARDTQRVEARAVDPATGEPLVFATFRAVGTPGAPAAIASVEPAHRTGTAGHALADSLAARVADQYGNAVPGAPVVWTVRSGGGSISPQTGTTGPDGIAKAAWTLGPRLDSLQVADAAAGVALRTEFTATAQLPLGAQLVKVSGDAQTATVGTALPAGLRVAVRLMDGRPVQGVAVTWSAANGSGSVAPATAVTDANGEAAAQWTLGTAAGSQFATASATGATPVSFMATGTAGPATALVKQSGDNQQGNAGTVLAAPLVVRARDAYGNPVAGVVVNWTILTGGGSANPTQSTTDAAGTASTNWALGSASGTQTARAASGSLTPVTFTALAGSTGAIAVSVRLPTPNSVAGDSLLVAARITSTPASINSFTAQVADRVVSLTPAGTESQGTLSLVGLPFGPTSVRVRAGAVNGDSGVVVVPIIHDAPPQVTATAPLEGTVTGLQMRVDFDCLDDNPAGCSTVQVFGGTPGGSNLSRKLLASGTAGIHATITLPANYDGFPLQVDLEGVDSRNQRVRVSRQVYVESSPRWTEQASAGVRMLDFDALRVLYTADDGSTRAALRAGGGETVLRGPDPAIQGFLHSQGAIFSTPQGVFDWRGSGAAAFLGGPSHFSAAGDYAVFTDPSGYTNLYRRDLAAGTTLQLATDAGNIYQGVAANGDVVFWNSSYDLVRYRGGTLTPLTSDNNAVIWNIYPLTDGTNVVFKRITPCCGNQLAQTGMITADGTLVNLTSPSGYEPRPGEDYAANGGWAAWTDLDAGAIRQVFTRAPDGTVRQASLLGSSSSIRALGPSGQLAFMGGTRLYVTLPPYTAPPVDVGSGYNGGRLEWRGGTLVIILGRSAFTISY